MQRQGGEGGLITDLGFLARTTEIGKSGERYIVEAGRPTFSVEAF